MKVLQNCMSRHNVTTLTNACNTENFKWQILIGKILMIQHPFIKFIRLFHHQNFVLYGTHCSFNTLLGTSQLCQHNFEHNRSPKAWNIMHNNRKHNRKYFRKLQQMIDILVIEHSLSKRTYSAFCAIYKFTLIKQSLNCLA